MFENAKRYNVPNSAIYKRVLKLQQVMQVRCCVTENVPSTPQDIHCSLTLCTKVLLNAF